MSWLSLRGLYTPPGSGIRAARVSLAMEQRQDLISGSTRHVEWRLPSPGFLRALTHNLRRAFVKRTSSSKDHSLRPETEIEASLGPGSETRHRNLWGVLITGLLLVIVCLRLPTAGIITWLDSSWSASLIHAFNKRLQFGDQISHSYGPLGFLSINWFDPGVAWPRLLFDLALCAGVAAGVALVAWRMRLLWRIFFLGSFAFLSASCHWPGDELWIETGLISWGLLSLLEPGKRGAFIVGLVALAVVGALIKFTLLVGSALTVAVLAFDLNLRGKIRESAGLLIGFVLAYLAGWTLLGQQLSNLGSYLANSLTFSASYNQSMGGGDVPCSFGLIIAGLALVAVLGRGMALSFASAKHSWLRPGLLCFWLASFIFLKWKHGFVRADGFHFQAFLGIVPVIGLMVEILPAVPGKPRSWGRAAGLTCLASAMAMTFLIPGMPHPGVALAPTRLRESVENLLRPDRYVRKNSAGFNALKEGASLPRLAGEIRQETVDVFGQFQLAALFNDLNYHPRPTLQSYAAYDRKLMALNDRFYCSANSPQFVLFDLTPIDRRFPPLEDAMVLRHLLLNFELVDSENRFLLLRRKTVDATQLRLVQEQDVRTGEPFAVSNQGESCLWMEIELQPTWLGRLRQSAYKPPLVILGVWDGSDSAKVKWYRAPTSMLAAGFLASPLIRDNEDVVAYYKRTELKRPSAYSVAVDDPTGNLWKTNVHIRIFRIENDPRGTTAARE